MDAAAARPRGTKPRGDRQPLEHPKEAPEIEGSPDLLDRHIAAFVAALRAPTPSAAAAAVAPDVRALRRAVVGTTAVEGPLPAPSPVFLTLADQLLVLDEIDPSSQGPYDWSPVQLDKTRSAGALRQFVL